MMPTPPKLTNEEILAQAGVTREKLGESVRREWAAWAREQPDVAEHPHWLMPWAELAERDREVDRRIGERLFCAGWRMRVWLP